MFPDVNDVATVETWQSIIKLQGYSLHLRAHTITQKAFYYIDSKEEMPLFCKYTE